MSDASPTPVYTVGYQGLGIDAFLGLLRSADVSLLVDIRERPQSRKPDFSKRSLGERLESEGVGYLHVRELGCPPAIRNRYRRDGDWDRYTRDFLTWLATREQELDEVEQLSRQRPLALLCFEADVNRCHRLYVAQAISARTGAEVIHLQS